MCLLRAIAPSVRRTTTHPRPLMLEEQDAGQQLEKALSESAIEP